MIDPEDVKWITDKDRRELALTFREHAASPLNAAWLRMMAVEVKGLFHQFQTLKDFTTAETAKLAGMLAMLQKMMDAPTAYGRWLAAKEKDEEEKQEEQ